MKQISSSTAQTITFGKKIAAKLKGGDIVLLYGELGAGKTTLVKGIAKYFGIKKNITSPTFTLMNVYPLSSLPRIAIRGKLQQGSIAQLVHIDTYRLRDEEELLEIGAEDYLGAPETVCVIEWPEKLKKLLKNKKVIKIKIEHLDKGRKIIISKKSA